MKFLINSQSFIFLFLICGFQCLSQTFELTPGASTMTIQGSSSLHDWEMKVGNMNGEIRIDGTENEIRGIDFLNFSVVAESLDGGKKGMNKDAYEALKTGTFKTIDFKFEKLNSVTCTSGNCQLSIQGTLTVAGDSKAIDVALDAHPSEDRIVFTGRKSLKMTDFNVEPPRAFLGLIRAYDDVLVKFELVFLRN